MQTVKTRKKVPMNSVSSFFMAWSSGVAVGRLDG
jgi:hypothetical protein